MANSFNDSRINLQITLVNDSAYIYTQIYALLIIRLKTLPLLKEQHSIIYLAPDDTFEDKLGICTHYSLVPVVIPKDCLPLS